MMPLHFVNGKSARNDFFLTRIKWSLDKHRMWSISGDQVFINRGLIFLKNVSFFYL